MKKILAISLMSLILGVISCNTRNKINPKPIQTSNELKNQLDFLFHKNDTILLLKFFNDWAKNIPNIPNNQKSEHERVVYDIYSVFYTSFGETNINDWSRFNKNNKKLGFFLIQNKLLYSIIPNDNLNSFSRTKNQVDTIKHFTPKINFNNVKPLYLTNEYYYAINDFLGAKYLSLDKSEIIKASMNFSESRKRYRFLSEYIYIIPGHWRGYFHIETHPEIDIIILNKEKDKALIEYRYEYGGGKAVLEKTNDKWEITSTKNTWIE